MSPTLADAVWNIWRFTQFYVGAVQRRPALNIFFSTGRSSRRSPRGDGYTGSSRSIVLHGVGCILAGNICCFLYIFTVDNHRRRDVARQLFAVLLAAACCSALAHGNLGPYSPRFGTCGASGADRGCEDGRLPSLLYPKAPKSTSLIIIYLCFFVSFPVPAWTHDWALCWGFCSFYRPASGLTPHCRACVAYFGPMCWRRLSWGWFSHFLLWATALGWAKFLVDHRMGPPASAKRPISRKCPGRIPKVKTQHDRHDHPHRGLSLPAASCPPHRHTLPELDGWASCHAPSTCSFCRRPPRHRPVTGNQPVALKGNQGARASDAPYTLGLPSARALLCW